MKNNLREYEAKIFMKVIPESLLKLSKLFKGYQFILVGGCLRNYFLKQPIKDWDITTNATPEQMIEIAKANNIKYYDVGSEYGTISFVFEKPILSGFLVENISSLPQYLVFEVTTFRSDGNYSDGRHPDKIEYASSFKEDCKRRDLTINGIGYNIVTNKFIDYFNGYTDIKNRTIRCIGEADERFKEDALRMLRVVRFSCQLGFMIDKPTYKGIKENINLLRHISKERVRDEFIKILESHHADYGLGLMKQLDIIKHVFPALQKLFYCTQNTPYHLYDVWHHTLMSIKQVNSLDWALKLVMLLHDIGKSDCKTVNDFGIDNFIGHGERSVEIATEFLNDLKFDKETIKRVLTLIRHHDDVFKLDRKHIKKKINKLSVELLGALFIVRCADIRSQNGLPNEQDLLLNSSEFHKMFDDILDSGEPIFLKDLDVNGNDIKALGFKGEQIGKILERLLSHVLSKPEDNVKEKLLTLVDGVK